MLESTGGADIMLQDCKLGLRMLVKFPGLTFAGGLAIAIAIGISAGWYDLWGKLLSPTIPLPAGDRIVLIETTNALTNAIEPRVLRDFVEWRGELRTIENLGAYRTDTRNLIVGDAAPEPIHLAELTADAFATARVPPLLGRALADSDEMPAAPSVVVLGYDVWQRFLGGRQDVVGVVVQLGNTATTVIGVMPKDFAFPVNHDAWTPLTLRASYDALEGGAISVIGRLAPGVSRAQANAELRVIGERTAAALPSTHEHLRPRVWRLGESSEMAAFTLQSAMRNVPALLVLAIACLSVGTLVYARTATREGEIAVRSALGASRARIVCQLFVETLVLASIAAAIGLVAADRVLTRAIANVSDAGGAPFWMTGGLAPSTILYGGVLAIISAAVLSVLPALRATRAQVQPHLANTGSGGATLRFGRVWTGAMVVQVALTAAGIPVAMETVNQATLKLNIRSNFPSREFIAAYVDIDRPVGGESGAAYEARRARTLAALERRIAQEPGVAAVTFADRTPGTLVSSRVGEVAASPLGEPLYDDRFNVLAVGPGFFDAFERPIVDGRPFHADDWNDTGRTVIVNEAFVRAFLGETGRGSPIGARIRYRSAPWYDDDVELNPNLVARQTDTAFEIVGVVRDFGLDPDDAGDEQPFVFHTALAGTVAPFALIVRVRSNPDSLAARLPIIAAGVDARLFVRNAQPLDVWIRQRDESLAMTAGALAAVMSLVLFLSALGIFALVSISVSRRTREIGLRIALGARPRQVLAGILSRAVLVVASGVITGGTLLLWAVALGQGPTGRPAEDVALFAGYLTATSAIMFAAGLLACIAPAGRALRMSPTDALREG